MIGNEGFYLQNTVKMNKKYDEDEFYLDSSLGNGEKIIMDKYKSVGGHCLTFLKNRNGSIDRSKFYNKFICNLECCSVDKKTGSKLYEYIYNTKDGRLFNTIQHGKEFGILRLETTDNNEISSLQEVKNTILEMEKILLKSIKIKNYFYCSVK